MNLLAQSVRKLSNRETWKKVGTQTNTDRHTRHPPGKNYSPRRNLFRRGQKIRVSVGVFSQTRFWVGPNIQSGEHWAWLHFLYLKISHVYNEYFWTKMSLKEEAFLLGVWRRAAANEREERWRSPQAFSLVKKRLIRLLKESGWMEKTVEGRNWVGGQTIGVNADEDRW